MLPTVKRVYSPQWCCSTKNISLSCVWQQQKPCVRASLWLLFPGMRAVFEPLSYTLAWLSICTSEVRQKPGPRWKADICTRIFRAALLLCYVTQATGWAWLIICHLVTFGSPRLIWMAEWSCVETNGFYIYFNMPGGKKEKTLTRWKKKDIKGIVDWRV